MALLLRGKTVCRLCDQTIEAGEDAVGYPHFVLNEHDPLYPFSDGAFHAACVRKHSLGHALAVVYEAYASRTGPGKRKCAVCSEEILDPDECVYTGYLADARQDALGKFNCIYLHKHHIGSWPEARRFLDLARQAVHSGRWKGRALPDLASIIEGEIGAQT